MFDLMLRRRTGAVVAGDIFRGIEETSGREVDILVMESDAGERATMVSATVRLHKALCKLDHPYLYRIHRFMSCGDHPVIVTEPRAESVSSLMGKRGVHPGKLLHLAIQAARGFRAAEGVGIGHMSLQPAYFQLRSESTVRIMGFSLWNHLYSAQPTNGWSNVAPAPYLAPEVARGERPDIRSDIYSFGVCMLYFLTCQEPADKLGARQILRIEQDIIPSNMADMFSAMLMEKPSDRPENWSQVVALLKGESITRGSRGAIAIQGKEKTDVKKEEEEGQEDSAPVRPRVERHGNEHQSDFLDQSGFLHGMMEADVEFDVDDVLGQLQDMAGSEDAAEFASDQMAGARGDSPVDIMAKAVMDGDMDDLRPEDIGSGLISQDAALDSGIDLTPQAHDAGLDSAPITMDEGVFELGLPEESPGGGGKDGKPPLGKR